VVPPVLGGRVWWCTGEAVAHCLHGDKYDTCEGHYFVEIYYASGRFGRLELLLLLGETKSNDSRKTEDCQTNAERRMRFIPKRVDGMLKCTDNGQALYILW